MEEREFQKMIISSLKELFLKDALLLNSSYDINERSVSHKLAIYIGQYLSDNDFNYDVDVEYNRMAVAYDANGIDIGNVVGKTIRYEDHPQKERFVYPDIIIHKRNQPINIGIIEIKMSWKNNRKQLDYEKVNEYIKQINYQYGVFIEIHPNFNETTIEYGPFK